MIAYARARHRGLLSVAVLLVAGSLGGCVTLSPGEISAMSSVDLCAFQDAQGRNLTEEASRAIQGELQRRNDNCRKHAAEVSQRRADVLYEQMYGSPDDP